MSEAVERARDRLRRRGRARAPRAGAAARAPTRRCAPRSSTTAGTRSPRPRRTSRRAGIPVRTRERAPECASGADALSAARRCSSAARAAGRPRAARAARARREDVELVGGAVRDLLLGRDAARAGRRWSAATPQRSPRELARLRSSPVGAAERSASIARALRHRARRAWDGGRIDVADARAECYPRPARCPRCAPGTLEEDCAPRLHRQRDRAWRSAGEPRRRAACGRPHALEDLARAAAARAARAQLPR